LVYLWTIYIFTLALYRCDFENSDGFDDCHVVPSIAGGNIA